MHGFFKLLWFTAERNHYRRHRFCTLLTSICHLFVTSCPSEVIIVNGYGVPAAIITSVVLRPDHSSLASLPASAALQAAQLDFVAFVLNNITVFIILKKGCKLTQLKTSNAATFLTFYKLDLTIHFYSVHKNFLASY